MATAVAENSQVEVGKRCYLNQTAGWLGVVKLDHLGAQMGAAVEPHGQVYLTDDEAVLTARAPKDPKDNPFVEQMFQGVDDKGVVHPMPMRPLILVDGDGDEGQGDRYVPGRGTDEAFALTSPEGIVAGAQDAHTALAGDSERDATIPTQPMTPVPAVKLAAAVPADQATPTPASPDLSQTPTDDWWKGLQEADVKQAPSWVENANRTAEPQSGSLGGGKAVGPAADSLGPVQAKANAQAPAPQGTTQVDLSETAGVTENGEETGAADIPAGDPPQGEFAQHEEVGTPAAPSQEEK